MKHPLQMAALALSALQAPSFAQCQVAELVGSGPKLGWWNKPSSIAASGDTLVVGTPAIGFASGSAYAFVRSGSGWVEEAHLTKSVTFPSMFGANLALEGDTLISGDPWYAFGARTFVYERVGSVWTEAAPLGPVDAPPDSQFGWSVALSGDTIAVGAPGFGWPYGLVPGRVLIYEWNGTTWSYQTTLLASGSPGNHDGFGWSLALEGDRLLVGSPEKGVGPGAVYVFERSGATWSETDKLVGPGGNDFASFGSCIALDGSSFAVARYNPSTPLPAAGVAYVYSKGGDAWILEAVLSPQGSTSEDRFASTLDLRGDRLVVGALGADHAGLNSGVAYEYERSLGVWTERDRLYGDDTGADDWFGNLVVWTDDGEVAVGTVHAGTYGSDNHGKVYLFQEDPACPTAAFTGSPTSGKAPLSVAFQDLSVGAAGAPTWDFGDGTPPASGFGSIEHTYTTGGDFDVSATVENVFGIDRRIELDYVKILPTGKAILRNGTGSNPLCFASTSVPTIGKTWTAEVDASTHAGAAVTFVAIYAGATQELWSAFGEILVAPPLYGLDQAPIVAGIGHHAIEVPFSPELVGLWIYAQGGSAGGFAVLCNGVDLQFGH